MPKRKPNAKKRQFPKRPAKGDVAPVGLRIVGGSFRGRKLLYGGDTRVRPMKDRTREAVFNLIGPTLKGKHAIDLFAGTGALALEAISRGAESATLIEQHIPTAQNIRRNIGMLDIESACDVISANVFLWWKRGPELPERPWVVFCSPPYRLFVDAKEEMLELIHGLIETSPPDSIFVVESDDQFDFDLLPEIESWRCRVYTPAHVGVLHKPSTAPESP